MATPLPALSTPLPASAPKRRQAVQWGNTLFVLPYLAIFLLMIVVRW